MDDLRVGTTYDVRHNRKGRFELKLTEVGDAWVTGEISSGVATNISDDDYVAGEVITIRRTHASFIAIRDEEAT